ncbi:unnamed protein product, partial [Hapterophycus canaliculatus]
GCVVVILSSGTSAPLPVCASEGKEARGQAIGARVCPLDKACRGARGGLGLPRECVTRMLRERMPHGVVKASGEVAGSEQAWLCGSGEAILRVVRASILSRPPRGKASVRERFLLSILG